MAYPPSQQSWKWMAPPVGGEKRVFLSGPMVHVSSREAVHVLFSV